MDHRAVGFHYNSTPSQKPTPYLSKVATAILIFSLAVLGSISIKAQAQAIQKEIQDLTPQEFTIDLDPVVSSGVRRVLSYYVPSSSTTIKVFDLFDDLPESQQGPLEKVQVFYNGSEIKLVDQEAADCNLAIARIVRFSGSLFLLTSERFSSPSKIVAQSDPTRRKIKIFSGHRSVLPGDSSVVFRNILETIPAKKICSRSDAEADAWNFFRKSMGVK